MTWLTALWDTMSGDILRERNLSPDTIQIYTENIASELATVGGDSARLALESGFVDGLKSREELRSFLTRLSGKDGKGNFKHISLNHYLTTITRSFTDSPDDAGSIGIIIAEGAILNGKQPVGRIGGDTMGLLIRQAREDSKINGLVIRVVSGGGSVFASEIIRQEIIEYKKTGKPLVISMGAMAASGGYWIAADADEIWASPVTLTGSIGIFAAIPTFENSLSELGIYSDGVGTTTLASALDVTRPLSPMLKEAMQTTLHHGYDQFLNIVSTGRDIPSKKMKDIAEGRVFDGEKAKELGLVDKLGTLDDAIDAAAGLAGLDDYTASYISRPLSVKEEFLQIFSSSVIRSVVSTFPPAVLTLLRQIIEPVQQAMLFDDPEGLYVHSPIHELSL